LAAFENLLSPDVCHAGLVQRVYDDGASVESRAMAQWGKINWKKKNAGSGYLPSMTVRSWILSGLGTFAAIADESSDPIGSLRNDSVSMMIPVLTCSSAFWKRPIDHDQKKRNRCRRLGIDHCLQWKKE
jgi:hypothetical protein